MSSRWLKLHVSLKSSFLRYADSIVLCPMGGLKTMATVYLLKELVSEICSFHRLELTHRPELLLNTKSIMVGPEKAPDNLIRVKVNLILQKLDFFWATVQWLWFRCCHKIYSNKIRVKWFDLNSHLKRSKDEKFWDNISHSDTLEVIKDKETTKYYKWAEYFSQCILFVSANPEMGMYSGVLSEPARYVDWKIKYHV